MQNLFLILAFLLAGIGYAQTKNNDKDCPYRPDISDLCTDVGQCLPDKDKISDYIYAYERVIYESSCVNLSTDSEDEIKMKVQDMWVKYAGEFICTSPQFNVPKGNIIKLAVRKGFTDFIKDVVYWGVDLNIVDKSDNRTVLDYLRDELKANKGNPTEPQLKSYYDLLRKAGAKHKSEL